MKLKSIQFKSFLLGGMIFFSSCSNLYNPHLLKREIAEVDSANLYLTAGLYSKALNGKNIFDSEGKAKLVFNLPPYTNPGGIGILPEMIKTIDGAQSSIRLSVFQFNHSLVFEAIKRAALRGVKIYISTDLCYSGKIGYKEYFDDLRVFLDKNGQSSKEQIVDDGTASCETMFNHNKYMIVDYELKDKTLAWFGSFNPTNHGAVENVELAIVVNNYKIAEILKLDFDQQISGKFKVYKKGIYSILKDGVESIAALSEEEVKTKLKEKILVTYPKVRIGDTEFEFIISPKVKSLTRIVEEVYAAKSEILFSSFAIADQMLISSLINKSKTSGSNYNLFSVLSLPHPFDETGYTFVKNGDLKNQSPLINKNPNPSLNPIVDEIKTTMATPVNYLTPKGELKSTFHYIYPKGELGGAINKVSVEGIFNSKVIDEKNTYQRLISYNIPVFKSSMYGELHNKLFLIDEAKTIFGSHNFSQSAENSNDELTVIINSPKLTKLLKEELYNKTKLFSVSETNPEVSYSGGATIAITEIMSDSAYKMNWNKKIADIGDYIEIYNYGEKSINLLGYRIDDHYFPDNNNDIMDGSTFSGYQGALARLVPSKDLNQLGVVDYSPVNNILAPGKVALIVGKYFNETFYKAKFEEQFKKKNGKMPSIEDYPILFTTSEFYSAVLGDSTSGITGKDRLTIYGVDGTTVIDRFNSPRITKTGVSIERSIDIEKMRSYFNSRSYDFVLKNFSLKNGTKLFDKTILPNYPFTTKDDWSEQNEVGSTPGIVNFGKRGIAANSSTYTIEAEFADVHTNTFKKSLIVIKDNKIHDITNSGNSNYPAPILKDVLIFPGLVDTHNHIKYNTMPVWKVSKTYENRNQWPEETIYKNGVKELYKKVYIDWPECNNADESVMNKCLAENRCKIMKYAEIKALIGGTTSIQGSSSFDESSSDITFKGLTGYTAGSGNKMTKSKAKIVEDLIDNCSNDLARNIEREKWVDRDEVRTTAQPIFGDAFARKSITDPLKFKNTPSGKLLEEFKNKITNTFFIHLGEGIDQSSKSEWNELEYLKLAVPQTTIIHGTAFSDSEFVKMGANNQSIAWSPTSNLLLYKKTTDVVSALKNKVNVSIGSDWSLSGTKSLLYELKVADKVNKKYFKNEISNLDLLKMVTINGAKATHLENLIGSIEKNKLADFFVVNNALKQKTPFDTLINLKEENIDAVFVGGKPILGNYNVLNSLNHTVLDFDMSAVKDSSCSKNLAISISPQTIDQLIDSLNRKTADGFKSLSPKTQQGLGVEFGKIDPLCSDNDKRMQEIINFL
jgi:phosphatidylserine/phosphatidylglycerophosphate/cardiolipin synthase-like enzyme